MHTGGGEQVHTAYDIGDALRCIVDHNGKMVGGRHILARQHHIAMDFRRRQQCPPSTGVSSSSRLPATAIAALAISIRQAWGSGLQALFDRVRCPTVPYRFPDKAARLDRAVRRR